jgi:methionyl-tRNA synthetase
MSVVNSRKLFVTTALPYANGPFHIGHIMEYIQADIWVRFMRMRSHEVHFVGADDAHGAPIMIAAEKAGVTPQEFVAGIAAGRKQYLTAFILNLTTGILLMAQKIMRCPKIYICACAMLPV